MTNETAMLKALLNGLKINPKFQPQNNKQAYLAYLCGLDIALPEPRTTEEVLLYKLCADGGKYLHTMTIRTYLGKITMTLKNNSAESLTGVYKENTDIFNGATLIIRGADIGSDEDFYATVIGYEGGDVGLLAIDKDFPFPVIGSMPNVIDVMSGEVIDTVTTKDGGKIEQEKKVEITKNGVTEITADEGYTLSKVTANVNVGGGENKLNQMLRGELIDITKADLEGVTAIPEYAFYLTKTIVSVDFPDSIESIGESAFNNADELTTLYFPDKPITFGTNAFHNQSKLSAVHIKSLSNWCKSTFVNSLSNPISRNGTKLYLNNEHIIDLIMPNDIDETGVAMRSYQYLESVYIPSNIKTITDYAFNGCKQLRTVTMEEGVITIGRFVCSGSCSNLKTVNISNTVTSIGAQAFYGATALVNLTIPASVINIDYGALHIGNTTSSTKATIVFLGTTPPTIAADTFKADKLNKIIVPKGCGEAYKTATNWANFADYIEEAAE